MIVELIRKGARYAVIIIRDGGKFYTDREYEITLNGIHYGFTRKTVNCIWGLKPDTRYSVSVGGAKTELCTDSEFVTLDVRKFGAHGDGISDDTVYFQAAIMACPENSRVLVPAGTYKITNIFFKSGVRMELAAGAKLIADNERYSHPIFPGMIEAWDEKSEYNLGTWEGNPLPMFAGIITMLNVENSEIYGEGEVCGGASHNDWWYDEKKMRGAFRPRTVFLSHTKGCALVGIRLSDSPSWTVHPYFSESTDIISLTITNPKDAPNTDGIDVESCKDVRIIGIEFSLGDDCVAIKSGKLYMAKYNGITENVLISNCLMIEGHGAVTLGSEMSSGIRKVLVENCEFFSTDRGLRIKTRRGRGSKAIIDEVNFRNILMDGVMTPFVVNCFYFCDPDGRTEYVQTNEKLPVDERTPYIKRLDFSNICCINTNVAAGYFCGLPERPIESVVMENITVSYAENAVSGLPAMNCSVREMLRRGFYARNVAEFKTRNVVVSGQDGPVYDFDNVNQSV